MRARYYLVIWGALTSSLFLYNCSSPLITSSHLGEIKYPENSVTSESIVRLGRSLFFDKRLSRNNTIACSSCHTPSLAFTDGKTVSEGVDGRKTERNSPSILNSAYLKTVMFDAHLPTLEQQVIVPIQEHNEMDMNMIDCISRLRAIPEYQNAAIKLFDRNFDAFVLTRSIAAFERTLISDNSRFDQYYFKKRNSLNESELRGWKLFSEKLNCTSCHPAPHFTTFLAENNGIYSDYGKDKGRFRIHNDSSDIGKFKVPSLRNVELTAPYMHDGSFPNLISVIEHYAKGGAGHWNQNIEISGFQINDEEQNDLIQFLHSLTDTSYMQDFNPL